jgi:hypothetical protein
MKFMRSSANIGLLASVARSPKDGDRLYGVTKFFRIIYNINVSTHTSGKSVSRSVRFR